MQHRDNQFILICWQVYLSGIHRVQSRHRHVHTSGPLLRDGQVWQRVGLQDSTHSHPLLQQHTKQVLAQDGRGRACLSVALQGQTVQLVLERDRQLARVIPHALVASLVSRFLYTAWSII